MQAQTRRHLPVSTCPISTRCSPNLGQRGVEFERFEDESGATTDAESIIDAGDYKVALFKDPDGNIYSING